MTDSAIAATGLTERGALVSGTFHSIFSGGAAAGLASAAVAIARMAGTLRRRPATARLPIKIELKIRPAIKVKN